MSKHGSLFERLAGETPKGASLTAEASVVASVTAHLARMLGTRAGSVQILPDYGLPDLNDMRLSLHDAQSHARQAIQAFIEAYEPRLSKVRVGPLQSQDPLQLSFVIEALLEVRPVKRKVSFMASLDAGGSIKVQ